MDLDTYRKELEQQCCFPASVFSRTMHCIAFSFWTSINSYDHSFVPSWTQKSPLVHNPHSNFRVQSRWESKGEYSLIHIHGVAHVNALGELCVHYALGWLSSVTRHLSVSQTCHIHLLSLPQKFRQPKMKPANSRSTHTRGWGWGYLS